VRVKKTKKQEEKEHRMNKRRVCIREEDECYVANKAGFVFHNQELEGSTGTDLSPELLRTGCLSW